MLVTDVYSATTRTRRLLLSRCKVVAIQVKSHQWKLRKILRKGRGSLDLEEKFRREGRETNNLTRTCSKFLTSSANHLATSLTRPQDEKSSMTTSSGSV
ncbi:hypothetical protein Bca4012_025951 [Brassica carinata]